MSTARPPPACGQGLTDTQLLFHIIQNYTVIISACSRLSAVKKNSKPKSSEQYKAAQKEYLTKKKTAAAKKKLCDSV